MVPQRAPVRPRVLAQTGEALLLEEEILALLGSGARGEVLLFGLSGAGKTTALQHLAAVLPPDAGVALADACPTGVLANPPASILLSPPGAAAGFRGHLASYQLAPWGEDDWIEYLLVAHPVRCASVINRLRLDPDRSDLSPLPELWRIVLDEMAAEDTVAGSHDALRRYLARALTIPSQEKAVRQYCLDLFLGYEDVSRRAHPDAERLQCGPDLRRILRHRDVKLVLAADAIVADLRVGSAHPYLERHLPRALIRAVAAQAKKLPGLVEGMRDLLATGGRAVEPMLASILHATDTGWVPEGERRPNLAGAYLDHAAWPYLRMPGVNLREADLSHAYLREAVFDNAIATSARLNHANLQGASLLRFAGSQVDMSGADLSLSKAERASLYGAKLQRANLEGASLLRASLHGVDLTGACLVGADLRGASLENATIAGADFSGATLEGAKLSGICLREATFAGACFACAELVRCNLEYLQLPAADFHFANLTDAYLTASWMPEANFENACLRNAGLADVQWEGALLRGADLRGASFHAGSSRNGLVGSPIASEGSRTGFYTDDSEEQYFKAPEEIRKANLRGADLRGARLDGVDFYLVDLRDALYDPEQEGHLRRCRAILEAQV